MSLGWVTWNHLGIPVYKPCASKRQLLSPLALSIMSSYLTLAVSYLPPGNLPPWLLFTTFLSVFNTVQNYSTTSLSKQVYGAKPQEGKNLDDCCTQRRRGGKEAEWKKKDLLRS